MDVFNFFIILIYFDGRFECIFLETKSIVAPEIMVLLKLMSCSIFRHQGFLSRRLIFRARNFTCSPDWARKKMGVQNENTRLNETQLETVLVARYYLISTDSFHF